MDDFDDPLPPSETILTYKKTLPKISLLVYWFIGLLVYWFISLLVYWFIGSKEVLCLT